jgi:F0F1-type ATP synthase assembly protein I
MEECSQPIHHHHHHHHHVHSRTRKRKVRSFGICLLAGFLIGVIVGIFILATTDKMHYFFCSSGLGMAAGSIIGIFAAIAIPADDDE